MFLSEPKQKNLQDPQSLNSYSYANDNPITKSDPSGKCAGPLIVPCIFIIGAGISSVTTYAGDVLSNINNGSRNPYTDNLSSPGAYVIGDLSGGASLAFLQEYRAYASGLEFVSSLAQDDANGNPRNYRKAGIAAGTTLRHGARDGDLVAFVDYALHVIHEKLPLGVQVRARLQACICACAEVPYARVHKVLMLRRS